MLLIEYTNTQIYVTYNMTCSILSILPFTNFSNTYCWFSNQMKSIILGYIFSHKHFVWFYITAMMYNISLKLDNDSRTSLVIIQSSSFSHLTARQPIPFIYIYIYNYILVIILDISLRTKHKHLTVSLHISYQSLIHLPKISIIF